MPDVPGRAPALKNYLKTQLRMLPFGLVGKGLPMGGQVLVVLPDHEITYLSCTLLALCRFRFVFRYLLGLAHLRIGHLRIPYFSD
jgi:hypothetical protein